MANVDVYAANSDVVFDLITCVNELSTAIDVNSACLILERQILSLGHDLLSIKFCDVLDEKPAIRPFGAYPRGISEMAEELRTTGGCPISQEAQKRLSPFDAMSIDNSFHSDFLSSRFLQELKKMDYAHVAVIPILFGRGLAVYTIGLKNVRFEGQLRDALIGFICNATASLIGLFPEVSKLFETKQLSSIEARSVMLSSNGYSDFEIGEILQLSEHTVSALLANAAKRLGARNRSHLTAKALAMGEISNMQCD